MTVRVFVPKPVVPDALKTDTFPFPNFRPSNSCDLMPRRTLLIIAFATLLRTTAPAIAADILDNTSQSTGTIASVQSGGYISGTYWSAVTVSNDSDTDIDLSSMTIGLFSQNAGTYDIFVELWSVADDKPDSFIPDMNKQESVISAEAGQTLFTDVTICTFTLPANTSRAIVVWTNAEDLSLSWQGMAGNAAPVGPLGVNYMAGWTSYPDLGSWAPVADGVNLSLWLTGTPVPEPSAWASGIVAALAICGLLRSASRRKTA